MAIRSDAIQTKPQSSSMTHTSSAGRGMLRSKNGNAFMVSEGQVLKGVVTDIHGKQITIQMNDGTNFTGQLADASNYSIGQGAAFQVTGTSGGVIYMQAITDAYLLGMEDTINQALEEAGLPKSPRNIEIVRSLLNSKQSISQKNITDTIRLCAQFPENPANAVITSKYLGLPMTKESIAQFEQYSHQTHQLLYKMDTLTSSLRDVLALVGDKAPDIAGTIGGKLLNLALEPSDFLDAPITEADVSNPNISAGEIIPNETVSGEVLPGQTSSEMPAEPLTVTNELEAQVLETADEMTETLLATGKTSVEEGEMPTSASAFDRNQLGALLTSEERHEFTEQTASLPLPEHIKSAIADGTISNRDILTAIQKLLPSLTKEQAAALVTDKNFHALLKAQFTDGWSISPKAFAKPENIEKLYEKLDRQLTALTKLSQPLSSQEPFEELGKSSVDMQNNLQFMKTLNESFTYFQLPLKLQEENAHGELYVMTKKGAMKKNPDSLSVLLHLEMDNLGIMDIHIKKEKTNIETRFFVDDKKTKALLETNIEQLSDAINEQGYSFSSEFNIREKKIDIVKDFIAKEKPIGDMKRYNFDLRA